LNKIAKEDFSSVMPGEPFVPGKRRFHESALFVLIPVTAPIEVHRATCPY